MNSIKDADISKVILKNGQPYCIEHGAMNKFTKEGIYRCCSTYSNKRENACDAGCELP